MYIFSIQVQNFLEHFEKSFDLPSSRIGFVNFFRSQIVVCFKCNSSELLFVFLIDFHFNLIILKQIESFFLPSYRGIPEAIQEA